MLNNDAMLSFILGRGSGSVGRVVFSTQEIRSSIKEKEARNGPNI